MYRLLAMQMQAVPVTVPPSRRTTGIVTVLLHSEARAALLLIAQSYSGAGESPPYRRVWTMRCSIRAIILIVDITTQQLVQYTLLGVCDSPTLCCHEYFLRWFASIKMTLAFTVFGNA